MARLSEFLAAAMASSCRVAGQHRPVLPVLLMSLALAALSPTVDAAPDTPRAERGLDARARALREEIETADTTVPPRVRLLQRQLLASLDRRHDLARATLSVREGVNTPKPAVPVPATFVALDALREELQRLDDAATSDERRIALLRADRDSAGVDLVRLAAALRQAEDRGDDTQGTQLRLETELTESVIAEIDAFLTLTALQQQANEQRRDAARRAIAGVDAALQPTADDEVAIAQRLDDASVALQRALAEAAAARDIASRALRDDDGASPARTEALRQRLANRDMAIEMTREALNNVNIERTAWQLVLRYYRDNDTGALAEARERGPSAAAALARRLEFVETSARQVQGAIAELETRLARAPDDADAPHWRELHDVFDERERMMRAAMLDERRLVALIARLRVDLDQRVGTASFGERLKLAGAETGAFLRRAWDFELFAVDEKVEIDGRQTTIARGVTVGKVVKAPLVLLLGLLLTWQAIAWWRRRTVRRGGDEARTRLTGRWVMGAAACVWALMSLALTGIPFAAFAFLGGAIAIGVGFGMQGLLRNLISGLIVLVARPVRLGDIVEVGGLKGTLVDIDLRASVLRDGDGAETMIPNAMLIEQSVRNVTYGSRVTRQSLHVVVDAAADARVVSDALRDAAENHGQLAPREPVVLFDDFHEDGLRFTLQYWVELVPGVDRSRIASDLRHMVLGRFAEAGVQLASRSDGKRARIASAATPPASP